MGKGELVYVDGYGDMWVPDVEITKDCSTYIYRPCRGYAGSLAVINIHDKCVGWVKVENLPSGPYANVREWMDRVGYSLSEIDDA